MKNRTNWDRVKKYFSLVPLRKIKYTKLAFVWFIGWINWVIHVLFLERVVHFLEANKTESFQTTILVYLSYILVYECVNFSVRKWWWVETEMLSGWDIDNVYLRKYIILDNNEIEKIWTGKLVGIINEWRITWLMSMTDVFMMGISFIISIIFTFFMISRVSIMYAFAFIILFFCILFYCYYVNTYMTIWRTKRYHLYNDRLKQFVKVLMSKNEILQSWKINQEWAFFSQHAIDLKKINQDMGIYRKLLRSTPIFIMSLILCWIFYVWWIRVIAWDMTLGALVWVTGTIIIMQKSIVEFVNFFVKMTKDFMKIEKMWDFFEETPELEGYDTWKDFQYKKWDIQIEKVSFWYDDSGKVFDNFDIELEGWKIYAFVWASWGGKTTLAKLISGYLRHDTWKIVIDGQDLQEVSLKSYYQNIWYLTQEPSVFDGSIIDNLWYALEKTIDEAQLAEVLKMSKCEFIYDFKDWINTEIWERWVRLSWGQKQRLAIAKIMLKDPKIIILDEPTSALDSFSEEQISYAMNNLFIWRTVIVIAHRLQTVKHADKIFVFENGEIVEQWNHNELIIKNGIYNKMLELQSWF